MRRSLIALILCALVAPAAAEASGRTVLRDCTDDGRLSKRYSQDEYRDALANIPTDVDEYTDCRDVIRRAQLAAAGSGNDRGDDDGNAGGGSSGGSGGGSQDADPLATATPKEKEAVRRAAESGNEGVEIGGKTVRPGSAGFVTDAPNSELPGPIIAVLALLGAAALAAGGYGLRNRVLRRQQPG